MKLAIIQQWDKSFGYYDIEMNLNIDINENNLNKYISYLKKKKFVVYDWNRDDEDGNWESIFDFISLFDYLNNVRLRVPVRRSLRQSNKKYELKIIKEYKFADRDFCSINNSFEYFIKKCKKYYSQKLAYFISPKSHLHRQRYGKFNFKFKNV